MAFESPGYWDVDMRPYLQELTEQLNEARDLGAIAWPWQQAVAVADMTGTARYQSGEFTGSDEQGVSLKDVQMSFLLDMAGGRISNGRLLVMDATYTRWNVDFSGSVDGMQAVMDSIQGTMGDGQSITGSMQGVFIGNPQQPDLLGGFILQSGSDLVQGLTILHQ
jgi:hypothetical protein